VNGVVEILPPADADAVEVGELYHRGRLSFVDSARYLIEAGRRLIAKKTTLAHGQWLSWLSGNDGVLGFASPSTASRLMRGARKFGVDAQFDENAALEFFRGIWGNARPAISHNPDREPLDDDRGQEEPTASDTENTKAPSRAS
jgi:hypothetical protein